MEYEHAREFVAFQYEHLTCRLLPLRDRLYICDDPNCRRVVALEEGESIESVVCFCTKKVSSQLNLRRVALADFRWTPDGIFSGGRMVTSREDAVRRAVMAIGEDLSAADWKAWISARRAEREISKNKPLADRLGRWQSAVRGEMSASSCCSGPPKTEGGGTTGPGLAKKAVSFGIAIVRWLMAGKPIRTEERQREIFSICRACPHIQPDESCGLCGCPLAKKIPMATESCPASPPKWGVEP